MNNIGLSSVITAISYRTESARVSISTTGSSPLLTSSTQCSQVLRATVLSISSPSLVSFGSGLEAFSISIAGQTSSWPISILRTVHVLLQYLSARKAAIASSNGSRLTFILARTSTEDRTSGPEKDSVISNVIVDNVNYVNTYGKEYSNFFVTKKSTFQSVDFIKISWQGIVFDNRTFDEESDFEISEVEQILDDSDKESK